LIIQLGHTDEQWGNYIPGQGNDGPGKVKELINHLMSLLRDELKTEQKEVMTEYLQTEGVQKDIAEKLVNRVFNSLQFYFCFSVLRKLEEKDRTALLGVLTGIYEKFIVRFERGYLSKIKPEECDREDWNEIAERMDYLTDYYVSRNYTKKGMISDLMDESGLQEETCEYWADLIDKNYLLLKLNYITEELGRLRKNDL